MNVHSYEIRTYRDIQAKADMARVLRNRRAAEAREEERAEETDEARWDFFLALMFATAGTWFVYEVVNWLLPIAWRMP